MRFALAALTTMVVATAGCYRERRADIPLPAGLRFIGEGWASYYGPGLNGHRTASGERFDKDRLTAAHRTLRFGSCVRVVHLTNKRWVQVRINDRGPFVEDRIIDLSEAAARQLGMIGKGVGRVRLYSCDSDRS